MSKIGWMSVIILVCAMLAACSPDTAPMPTLATLPTVTLAPALTPGGSSEAVATPSVAATTLDESYTGQDFLGRDVVVRYPADWLYDDRLPTDGVLVISNTQAALDNPDALLESGAVLLTISVIPAEFAMDEAGNVQSLVELVELVAEESEAVAGVQELTLEGFNAAQATFTGEQGDLLVIVVEQMSGFVVVAAAAPAGEIGQYERVVQSVAGATRYIVPSFGEG